MNERRNPTLCADNRFFSSSFHGFFPGDDSVASGSGADWRNIAIALVTPESGRQLASRQTGEEHSSLKVAQYLPIPFSMDV